MFIMRIAGLTPDPRQGGPEYAVERVFEEMGRQYLSLPKATTHLLNNMPEVAYV